MTRPEITKHSSDIRFQSHPDQDKTALQYKGVPDT